MNRQKPALSRNDRSLPSESMRLKLASIIYRHEQLKLSFNELNSQIKTGLLEVEDVFASLAVPLMKLVGLKQDEMDSEGRFSRVLISTDEQATIKDDDLVSSAMTAGNELMMNQRGQIMQLISIFKNIEAQVNERQNNIVMRLAKHQNFMKRFFSEAFTHVSEIHQSYGRNELSLFMLRLLKASFDRVTITLGSVEVGVEDLISDLSEVFCKPMAQYVKDLKADMRHGACPRLLEVIKEIDGAMQLRKFELEEARITARLAEQSRAETLTKLLKSEEIAKKLTTSIKLLKGNATETEESSEQHLIITEKEDRTEVDNLLWDFQSKKRKCDIPESPIGPKEPLGLQKTGRRFNMTRVPPGPSHVTRSQTNWQSLMTSKLLLGSSPTT